MLSSAFVYSARTFDDCIGNICARDLFKEVNKIVPFFATYYHTNTDF